MVMTGESMPGQSMQTVVESHLGSMGLLKREPSLSEDHPTNTGRAVVRGAMRPVVMYLIEQGVNMQALNTPEKIIAQASSRQDLNLGEELVSELSAYGPDAPRDWSLESIVMSLELDRHPLQKLAIAAKDKLSESARTELTRAELSQ
jgi:hypothetical protein